MEVYYYKKYTIGKVSGLYGKCKFSVNFMYYSKAVWFVILIRQAIFNAQSDCKIVSINVLILHTYDKNSFTLILRQNLSN